MSSVARALVWLGGIGAISIARPVLADERPDIVLVVIDTLRADRLGTYGYGKPTSPNLDELARRGTVFERAVAQAPWTTPSVASILTGKIPAAHGAIGSIEGKRARLATEQKTLAEMLRASGYRTAGIVTNPNVKAELGFGQGFDVFEERMLATAEVVTDWAVEQLRQERDAPLFLYLHYMDPHTPYGPAEEYRDRFVRTTPARLGAVVRHKFLQKVRLGRVRLFGADMEFLEELYDAEIAQVDAALGRLIREIERTRPLRSRGLLERIFGSGSRGVVITVTADHGEEFFDHGSVLHGYTVYREQTHVPLIFAGSGIRAQRVAGVVRSVDIAPTLLEVAGVRVPGGIQGVSLWGVLQAKGEAPPVAAVSQAEMAPRGELVKLDAIETADWKLLRDHVRGRVELYHLRSDPRETKDLAASAEGVRRRLEGELEAALRLAPRVEPETVEVDEATEERLRELGY